jgi:signal transduction histidine kinase
MGRLLACRDLTEQRESERRMQLHAEEQQLSKVMLERAYRRIDRANKDLQARTEQLDRLNAELRKLNEMKSNLLGNVSHELQTPLVSIRGYTEMILKERLGPITDEQRRGLSLGLKNIDRLISMIDNLLVFSRSEADLGPLKLERFSLRPLIEESLELLADKVREKRVHTVVRIEGEGPTIHADRDKIQQVFINLLSNAVKFNRPDGRVMLSVERAKPGYVAIVVEDSGVGIPADALDHVFERHYQVAADPDDSPRGSGIGLAIVQDILRSHGCRIDVSSEAGHGARFRFTLPLAGVTRRPAEPGDVGGEAAPAPAPEDDAPSAASSTSAPSGPAHPAEHGAGESADRSSDESPDQSPRDSDERHTPAADPIDSGDDVPERVGPPRPRPRFRIIRRPS